MSWWDVIKKKTCRYFLQRYLGQFLQEKLNLEQLNVDLYNGRATLKNVSLKVDALNDIFEDQGWAVEVITGHLGVLTVSVPWNALTTKGSLIEVSDVLIILRPIRRQTDGSSTIETMLKSVSSSRQLAEELMKLNTDEPTEANTNAIVGLEKFAETIDTVLNRIKATFSNIKVRLDLSLNDNKGIALVINIKELCYKNETGFETTQSGETDDLKREHGRANIDSTTIHYLPTFAKHNITFNGLQVSTDEFFIPEDTTYDEYAPPELNRSDGITILKIKEMLDIQLKMKQSEEIQGPKISLHAEIGSLFTFLTPRQVHILIKFWEAFFDNSPQKKIMQKRVGDEKSIKHNDQMTKSYMSGGLGKEGNWMNCIDDVVTPSEFSPHHDKLYEEDNIPESYYCNSMSSSMSSNSTIESAARMHRKNCNTSYGDILNFDIRIISIVATILHENVLIEETNLTSNNIMTENSRSNLTFLANKFFDSEFSEKDIKTECLVTKSHLYLRMIPIMISGKQQRNRNILSLVCTINTTRFDLFEVNDGVTNPLLSFDRITSLSDGYPKRPELMVTINSALSTSSNMYNTDISVSLENCNIEIDVTLIDRLSYVFGPSPYSAKDNIPQTTKKSTGSKDILKIISNTIGIKLRFPIYDAKPLHHPNRTPWWKQNIRADFLFIVMNEFRFEFSGTTMKIIANEMDAYYCEKDINTKIHLLRAYGAVGKKSDFTNNTIQITINIPFPEDIEVPCDIMASSKHSKLPFSSQRVCRQSDTTHNKRHSTDCDYILLPGETKEIKAFFDSTMKISKLQIRVDIPHTDLYFESKHLYELIYNRLNSDLFMWEPSSPIYVQSLNQQYAQMQQSFLTGNMLDSIYIPSILTSDVYDDISKPHIDESMKRDSDSESIYYSIREEPEISAIKTEIQKPCECTVEINIGKGSLVILVPVRDAENRVLPNQMGEFDIIVQQLHIYCTNGCKNNENMGYVCIQAQGVEVYHCGLVPEEFFADLGNFNISAYMKAILYKVPQGLTKKNYILNNKREMLSVVIETKKIPQQRIKRIKISAGIQSVTLRHVASPNSLNWLNQLIDFLDVTDYPIEDYCPFGIVNEIQVHLWDCAIDYRPTALPFRTVIEIGSFTLSKNMISSTSGDSSRFIAEDCILSIAPFDNTDSNCLDHAIKSLPSNNLIPVIDIGLFDISLRLNDKMLDKCPKFDLRCSVHDVHMRTCYDSGSALALLITHIANDGDLGPENVNIECNSSFHSTECSNIIGSTKSDDSSVVSDTQQQHVQLMMADAIKEIVRASENRSKIDKTDEQYVERGVDVYYFPDESNKPVVEESSAFDEVKRNELLDILNFETNLMASCCSKPNVDDHDFLPQIKADLGDVRQTKLSRQMHQEDEYCIIVNEEKSFLHQYGIQDLKVSDDPLRIVDNHFTVPNEKADLLEPPKDFPMPLQRYTLCELTITWHLYGGKDFPSTKIPSSEKVEKDKEKIHMSEAYKHGVSNSKGDKDIKSTKKTKEKITWKTKGGPERNHEVLVEIQFTKIRFSHEVYPNNSWQASRQVLLVQEIEVRDRLQSSDINKFLYHPYKTNLSSKSNSNMIVIKALHVRPNPQKSPIQECSLRISLLPLRLNIDQNTLVFLADFFTNLSNNCTSKNGANNSNAMSDGAKSTSTYDLSPPIMNVDEVPEAVQDLQARNLITTNLDLLIETDNMSKTEEIDLSDKTQLSDAQPTYFREVTFSPDVPICIDYHGRRIELSRGPVLGLLMGLGQLENSEIRLKKLICRTGILGIDKLMHYLCKEWLEDIKRNQLPTILGGVGPANAFVQLFKGIYDLFWLPIEQYQKDGRIIKGLQLGAQSFTARTALAALELTSRIIYLLQFTAETAFEIVSPGPSMRDIQKGKRGKKKRPVRPKDIREGVSNAYFIVKEGINDSANTIIETAIAEHDQKGYTGAVGAVMRQIPQLVVCPAVLATQATTNILGGVKNSLVPEAKIEAHEKWKSENE